MKRRHLIQLAASVPLMTISLPINRKPPWYLEPEQRDGVLWTRTSPPKAVSLKDASFDWRAHRSVDGLANLALEYTNNLNRHPLQSTNYSDIRDKLRPDYLQVRSLASSFYDRGVDLDKPLPALVNGKVSTITASEALYQYWASWRYPTYKPVPNYNQALELNRLTRQVPTVGSLVFLEGSPWWPKKVVAVKGDIVLYENPGCSQELREGSLERVVGIIPDTIPSDRLYTIQYGDIVTPLLKAFRREKPDRRYSGSHIVDSYLNTEKNTYRGYHASELLLLGRETRTILIDTEMVWETNEA